MCVATVFFAALTVGVLAGCGSQPTPSASGSDTSPVSAAPSSSESDTSAADAATDPSQDEIFAELEKAESAEGDVSPETAEVK